jgi:hypothetical protein
MAAQFREFRLGRHQGPERRQELVHSPIALVLANSAAGGDADAIVALGTFEGWAQILGGDLVVDCAFGVDATVQDWRVCGIDLAL